MSKTQHSRLPAALGVILLAGAGAWLAARLLFSGGSGIPGETNQQRLEYIQSFGWRTGLTHCELEEIRIPVDFDEVYEEYNALQRSQGFDLRRYRAHSVKKYTYEITRTDDDPVRLYADLLVEDGKIIAADVTSAEAGGLLAALADPQ